MTALLFRDDSAQPSEPDKASLDTDTSESASEIRSRAGSLPSLTCFSSTMLTAFCFLAACLVALSLQLQSPVSASGVNLRSDRISFRQMRTVHDMLEAQQAPEKLLEYSDVDFCPESNEPATLEAIPEKLKYLMVIGTQKAGTTWLFNALRQHPELEGAVRRPGIESPLRSTMENEWMANILLKEPKFFNRWPMPPTEWYMHAWNSTTIGEILAGVTKNKVLLDSSPQYLMVPTAAARVKASVPHAKFVIVVRDPPMRTFSDYSMMRRLGASCKNGNSRLCPEGTFLETIQQELKSREQSHPACLFNSSSSQDTTWMACFRCSFNYIETWNEPAKTACQTLEEEQPAGNFTCMKPHFGFIDQSKYAAQFAWWLRFFPPERFLFVTSGQLHDPEESVKVLNKILKHAEVGNAESSPFTLETVNKTTGFRGSYNTSKFTPDDHKALAILREHFRKDQEDLKTLVDMLYPQLNFTVQLESDP